MTLIARAATPPSQGASPPHASRAPFVFLAASLALVAGFFLVRPALSDLPYYHPRPSGTTFDYWWVTIAAFPAYGLALRAARRGAGIPLWLALGGIAVLYVALIPAPPQQSQDLYQYLLYGKMAAHGINPYTVLATSIQDPWRAWTLWDSMPTVYGPVWTFLSMGIASASFGSLTAAFLLMKAATAALVLLSTVALGRAAGSGGGLRDDRLFVILAFAANPLVLVSVGVGAHAEAAVVACVAGAILAERRDRPLLTTILLGGATLVKPYMALLLLPWFLTLARRRGLGVAAGHAAAATILAVAGYAPFWEGTRTFDGLIRVGDLASTSLAGSLIRLITDHVGDATVGSTGVGISVRVIGLVALIGMAIWAQRSARLRDQPWRMGGVLLATYVLVTPWFLPWHLLGLVLIAVVVADDALTLGVLTFSATSLVVASGIGPFLASDHAAITLVLQTAIRYGPPLVVAGWAIRRRAGGGSLLEPGAPTPAAAAAGRGRRLTGSGPT